MTPLLDTGAVAALLGVGEDWVRAHASDLGGVRIGHPRNGPLRFQEEGIDAYVEGRRLAPPTPAPARRPGPARRASGVHLVEIPEWAA